MNTRGKSGFDFFLEVVRPDGRVSQRERVHNLMPDEGRDHGTGVIFKGAQQVLTWYIGLYEGNYTPQPDAKASTIAALAAECTTYSSAQRVAFVPGAVANGSVDNGANKAEFVMTAAKTVYGGFIVSASPKGATTGVLISAVRFTSPKVLDVGDKLVLVAANSLVSA
ncbi:MAG: hypothetical protein V4645_09890 [Pseudomonadota bacterium]